MPNTPQPSPPQTLVPKAQKTETLVPETLVPETLALDTSTLRHARQRIHHAAQWLARIAQSYRPAETDDTHTALWWDEHRRTVCLGPFSPNTAASADGRDALTFTLAPGTLEVRLLRGAAMVNAGGVVLAGRDQDERRELVDVLLGAAGLDPAQLKTRLPYAIDHPPDALAPSSDAALVWEMLWSATHTALSRVAAAEKKRASPVRIWPHHFDMAIQVKVGRKRGSNAQSVGLGLAIDDHRFDRPYFYVSPWPYPPADALPAPPSPWRWNHADFTGLVAPALDLAHRPGAPLGPRLAEALLIAKTALGVGT